MEGDVNSAYLIQEIADTATDLKDYVQRNKGSITNPTQFTIVMKRKIKNLNDQVQQLILGKSISIEDKVHSLSDLSPIIVRALQLFPKSETYSQLFLDLSIISNYLVVNVAVLGRQKDIWRLQATANILANLLVKLPEIPDLPVFPQKSDPDYWKDMKRIRNALAITSGVYIEAVIAIYEFNYDNLIRWSNMAIHHFNLYIEFIEQLNFRKLLVDFGKKTDDDVFFTLRFYLMPIWNTYVFLLNIYRFFGSQIPDELDQIAIENTDDHVIVAYGEYVASLFTNVFNLTQQTYQEGLLSRNDNPDESDHMKTLHVIRNFARLYRSQFDVFHELLPLSENKSPEMIDTQISMLTNLLEMVRDLTPSDVNPLGTSMLAYYFDIYELSITYHGMKSLTTGDKTALREIAYIETQSKEVLEKTALLTFLYTKFSIAFDLENNLNSNLSTHLDNLELLKSQFQYKYRELVDIHFLEYLVYKAMDMGYQAKSVLDDLESNIKKFDLSASLLGQIKSAIAGLHGSSKDLPTVLFSPFDYHTWALPAALTINQMTIYYTPISAKQFKIIQ